MAHSYILSARSSVLINHFTGNWSEQTITRKRKAYQTIEIPDIEPAAFKVFLKFLYTDKLEATPEIIVGVLHAGELFFTKFWIFIFFRV